jgi:hypothetical protein
MFCSVAVDRSTRGHVDAASALSSLSTLTFSVLSPFSRQRHTQAKARPVVLTRQEGCTALPHAREREDDEKVQIRGRGREEQGLGGVATLDRPIEGAMYVCWGEGRGRKRKGEKEQEAAGGGTGGEGGRW